MTEATLADLKPDPRNARRYCVICGQQFVSSRFAQVVCSPLCQDTFDNTKCLFDTELQALADMYRRREKNVSRTDPDWDMESGVYFVSAGCDGPIKIGYAKNVSKRIQRMQVDCPYELVIMAVLKGGRGLEKEIHRRFATCRIQGEWFKTTDELGDFIADRYPEDEHWFGKRTA